jgi:hypothetical protein
MNEKIKELFKRAGGKTSIHNLMSNPMQQREYSELWDDNIQKFAELIVQECASVAYKTAWDDLTLGYGIGVIPLHISNTIKEHFGVEE